MKPKNFCLLVSTLMLSAFHVDAQVTEDMYSVKNDAVVVEKVIPFSVSKDMASAAVKSYFLTTLNDSNVTLKNSSDDYYVVKIRTPKLAKHSMGMWYTMGELTIDVRFKADRMKVLVSCNNIINSHWENANRIDYNPINAAPISQDHDYWSTNVTEKKSVETFNNLVLYMASIVDEVNIAVQNAKEEENW